MLCKVLGVFFVIKKKKFIRRTFFGVITHCASAASAVNTPSLWTQHRYGIDGRLSADITRLTRKLFQPDPLLPPPPPPQRHRSSTTSLHRVYYSLQIGYTAPSSSIPPPTTTTPPVESHFSLFKKGRSGVLPHPGPPDFERETWGYLNGPVSLRNTGRPSSRRL